MIQKRFCWWGAFACILLPLLLFVFLPELASQPSAASTVKGKPAAAAEPLARDDSRIQSDAKWAGEMAAEASETRTLSDMAKMWQKNARVYTSELNKQTTREMLMNLSESLYEWFAIPNGEDFSDNNTDIIRLLLRTRRFSHALQGVLGQNDARRVQMAGEICTVLRQLSEMIAPLAKEAHLLDEFTETGQKRLNELLSGAPDASPHSSERYGIDGMGIGLAANAYLLGLCGGPEHLESLLRVAKPGERMIGYGARYAAFDAMDRIMLRQCGNASLVPEARAVVDEYAVWREKRQLCPRKPGRRFSASSEGTPYTLGGTVGGLPVQYEEDVELPYWPACCFEGMTSLEGDILDNPDLLKEHNAIVAKHEPRFMIRDDPARGLTREDVTYIAAQSQRLAALAQRK